MHRVVITSSWAAVKSRAWYICRRRRQPVAYTLQQTCNSFLPAAPSTHERGRRRRRRPVTLLQRLFQTNKIKWPFWARAAKCARKKVDKLQIEAAQTNLAPFRWGGARAKRKIKNNKWPGRKRPLLSADDDFLDSESVPSPLIGGVLRQNGWWCARSFRWPTRLPHHTKQIHLRRKNNIGRNSCPIYLRRVNNGLRAPKAAAIFHSFGNIAANCIYLLGVLIHTLDQQQHKPGMGVLITCLCALKNVRSTPRLESSFKRNPFTHMLPKK